MQDISTKFSASQKPLLDCVNDQAKNDLQWFHFKNKKLEEYREKYKGVVTPGLAVYLENDLYVYEDKKLTEYIRKIVDSLLQGWEGPQPEISITIESGQYFNAYLDELHQLHIATEIFRTVQNEDQLASILAHELGHVLLRHNSEKSLTSRTGLALDLSGELSELSAKTIDSLAGKNKYQKKSEKSAVCLHSFGLVFSDILAPAWSRENEREADAIGLDLLMTAGYNYEELLTVIEYIRDAALKRSKRLEWFKTYCKDYIKNNSPKITSGIAPKVGKAIYDLVGDVGNIVFDEISSLTASLNKSHDTQEDRTNALKTYLQNVYDGGDLPAEVRTKSFNYAVHNDNSSRRLEQDNVAIKIINASYTKNSKTSPVAFCKNIKVSNSSPVISSLAAYQLHSNNKDSSQAIADLEYLLKRSEDPPAEVFLKLADIYTKQKKYQKANNILERGVETIGRDYRFLQAFIRLSKKRKKVSDAEHYTLQCKKYDSLTLGSLKALSNYLAANTYYHKCVGVLGYDPEKTKETNDSKVMQSLKKTWDKINPLPL